MIVNSLFIVYQSEPLTRLIDVLPNPLTLVSNSLCFSPGPVRLELIYPTTTIHSVSIEYFFLSAVARTSDQSDQLLDIANYILFPPQKRLSESPNSHNINRA
jgi:hypothetical protein